ncbi:MAG: GIY-YIG nuclease family protein [Alphaproteobacteria bacterium]
MGDKKKPEASQTYFVYVLGSCDAVSVRTYVGCTIDLERRLAEHNAGTGARSTRGREWRIIYSERAEDRSTAQAREWRLKQDRGFRKTLARLIPGIV